MSNTANRVKYGLKNVHYAKATIDAATGTVSFGSTKRIPGAVNLAMDPEGDQDPFYADDMVYYMATSNNGYSGDLEIALVPEDFEKEILKVEEDDNGVLVENANVEPEHFALLFEFNGDVKKIRHCMYYCSAKRAKVEGQTKEDKIDVKTETLSIKATPLPNGVVKVKTGPNTEASVYNNWYSAVYYNAGAAVTVAKAASISLGSVDISPEFNADVTNYTAATSNETNTVSATGANGATVTILVNGASHTSGQAATWVDGVNTVTVIATKTGCTSTAYTVEVTKETEGEG